MDKELMTSTIQTADRALLLLAGQVKGSDIEYMVRCSIELGAISQGIENMPEETKILPEYSELKTKMNIIQNLYIKRAREIDQER